MEHNLVTENVIYMTNTIIETVRELESINSQIVRELTNQQLIFSERFIIESAQHLKDLVSSDDSPDNVSSQIKIAEDLNKMLEENADKARNILDIAQNKLRILMEKSENTDYSTCYS
ncbi:MAG: hypothetical protein HQL78_14150 [Magnetococcales bacterium]|nr:hypothetical protein [Magnetococcales bacterium]MBF0421290.1 hypothetical protein [Magnetococcales bacterium]